MFDPGLPPSTPTDPGWSRDHPAESDPLTDAELVRRVKDGRAAMDALIQRHKGIVHGIFSKLFLQSGVEEDELIQMGFIALTQAATKWINDGRSKFGSYAFVCVQNAMRRSAGEQARKASSLHKRPLDEDSAQILDMLPSREEAFDMAEEVRERVAKLPPTYRSVVTAAYGLDGEFAGWQAIADATGLTIFQAKKALERALLMLREQMKSEIAA